MMQRAYRTLKRQVIELERPPGAGFTELEVARSLGLSKTPVREALARLHREGLVTPMPRAGYIVSPVTLHDAADLCDMRVLLQSEAAFLCARRRLAPESLERLQELALDEEYDELSGPGFEERIRVNYEFETIIANGSGNARLALSVVNGLDEIERIARLVMRLAPPSAHPGRSQQRLAIVDAIVAGDPDGAREAMRARGVSARGEILDALSSSPAVGNAPILL
jgi:DNA-binding GntR family transcriptional regulator